MCEVGKTFEVEAKFRTLQQDPSITVVPADKGKAVVVMDMAQYREKVSTLLNDENTYTKITDKRRCPSGFVPPDPNLLADLNHPPKIWTPNQTEWKSLS